MLTSATGTMPTQSSAPSTFCQKRMRRNAIAPPASLRATPLCHAATKDCGRAHTRREVRRGETVGTGKELVPVSGELGTLGYQRGTPVERLESPLKPPRNRLDSLTSRGSPSLRHP